MITQAQFALLSGSQSLDCLSTGEFELVYNTNEQRLMKSLCLTEAPTDILWDQLMADSLAISVLVKQDAGVQSENMRNYSYQLRDYANTWKMLSEKSGDLLNNFNACPSGITMQKNIAGRIYGRDPLNRHGHYYECDCYECI